ncbi:MAG: anti-sigma factor, partial [Alphaproteobacteria bacterium]
RVKGAPARGRSFELWLIEGGNAPVSLGLVPDKARGNVKVPAALQHKFANAVLAISDEPEGGSPTGKATGPVLALGQLSAI